MKITLLIIFLIVGCSGLEDNEPINYDNHPIQGFYLLDQADERNRVWFYLTDRQDTSIKYAFVISGFKVPEGNYSIDSLSFRTREETK